MGKNGSILIDANKGKGIRLIHLLVRIILNNKLAPQDLIGFQLILKLITFKYLALIGQQRLNLFSKQDIEEVQCHKLSKKICSWIHHFSGFICNPNAMLPFCYNDGLTQANFLHMPTS
eukprot:6755730-Ditylum_brightwellii.AAC.1